MWSVVRRDAGTHTRQDDESGKAPGDGEVHGHV
jgi:hypothetical protein